MRYLFAALILLGFAAHHQAYAYFRVVPGAEYTVATLPTCNATNKGVIVAVTDANSPTYNATVAGSGAVYVPVMCDGTNWKTR